MIKHQIKQLIAESFAEMQKKQIDDFLTEFQNFDVKNEKQRLKSLLRQLQELKRHSNTELYEKSESYIYTRRFFKLKEDIEKLNAKIKKYEENKHIIDTLARTHKNHIFHKHGKLI